MKQITITVPDNCELKQDGNTYTIVEKEKVTYYDIATSLFSKPCYYISSNGDIKGATSLSNYSENLNNCTSKKQAEKLLAINQLMNVAKYLNNDWQPDWYNHNEFKYFILIKNNKEIAIGHVSIDCCGDIYFKSKVVAKQAIEIIGESIIRLILCTDY